MNNEINKNNESDINQSNSTNKNYHNIYFNNINIGINNNNFIIENDLDKEYHTYTAPFKPKELDTNIKINNFFNNEKTFDKESINNKNKILENKSHSSKYIFKTEQNQNQNPYIKRNQLINNKYNKNENNIYRSQSLDDKNSKNKFLLSGNDINNLDNKDSFLESNDFFKYKRNYSSLNNENIQKNNYIKKYSKNNKNNKNDELIYISKNNFIKTEWNINKSKINKNEIKKNTTVFHQNFEKIKNRMTDLLDIYSELLYNKISDQINNEINNNKN